MLDEMEEKVDQSIVSQPEREWLLLSAVSVVFGVLCESASAGFLIGLLGVLGSRRDNCSTSLRFPVNLLRSSLGEAPNEGGTMPRENEMSSL